MFLYLYTMSEAVKKPKKTSVTETYKTGTVGLLDKVKAMCDEKGIKFNKWILETIKKAYERENARNAA